MGRPRGVRDPAEHRLKQEGEQLARFLTMVAEHKHKIGFTGTLLIEPKPQEPTKHQYDYDCHRPWVPRALRPLGEYKVNIEGNHATLAGHSFHHEVAYAVANGIFGSVDANRGDPQNGWDTDQFPNSVDELSLALYEILRGGGFTTGGFNFDTKLRRQSLDRTDLFHGHIGGIDTLARALLVAEALIDDGALDRNRSDRYAGWDNDRGRRSSTVARPGRPGRRRRSRRARSTAGVGQAGAAGEPGQPSHLVDAVEAFHRRSVSAPYGYPHAALTFPAVRRPSQPVDGDVTP